MKRFKHTFWRFREYEGTAFSEYLNDMAGKGWCLERISPIGTLVFEEKKKGVGHFCATVVPGETEFSEEDHPTPIETDDTLRVEAVKSVMLRASRVITALIGAVIFAIAALILSRNPAALPEAVSGE